MKIFLDFDDTIFNSRKFLAEYKQLYYSLGISEQDFAATYYVQVGGYKKYDLEVQLTRLAGLYSFDFGQLKAKVAGFLGNLKQYVFEDFYFLEGKLPKADLILLSFGEPGFQKAKVEGSAIAGYFSQVLYTDGSKVPIVRKVLDETGSALSDRAAFFVDDREDRLEEIAEALPQVSCVRMKRPEGRYSDQSSGRFLEVADFHELLPFMTEAGIRAR